ncbi:hypothetical protein K470DRAFT_258143 [Piedraia hortae CBS 480.64]|uniref:Anaphase-promoting complex subunit 4 n=1 Tax=Piedraia hortae CBS 480.64 TaxID=1314780 RepID=A0A6A7BY88_9PEZI|nr:hypothetical protein K470DRAFT_258143 [Piedraia hortae CBS 480.64]
MASGSLPLLSEKQLSHGVLSELVAYCDLRDLVAIVTEGHDVIVYRINGQLVFAVRRKDEHVDITAVSWKENGTLLAVGWSDGTCGLHSGENGKLLSQTSTKEEGTGKAWKLDITPDWEDDDSDGETERTVIGLVGWMVHCTKKNKVNVSSIEEFSAPDSGDAQAATRLARSISSLDVTTSLPRLSALSSHGARLGPDGSKFTSQAAMDSIFEPQKDAKSDHVDCLLLCGKDGHIQVLQDDTVMVGSCQIEGHPILHAAHPANPIHTILSRRDDGQLIRSSLTLPMDMLSGSFLPILTTNTKRIQNFLAYVLQTIRCIQHDFTAGLQFPTRLLHNFATELNERGLGSVALNLYNLAMTGDFSDATLEWLTDIVKDTNYKRWDAAISGMYSHVQNHVFINLIPALDRIAMAASTLRGWATAHALAPLVETQQFSVQADTFSRIIDLVDSLRLAAHKMLLAVIDEYGQWRAFAKWLKVMIEVAIAGPGGKSAAEMEDRELPLLDYGHVLAYMSDTMGQEEKGARGFVCQLDDFKGSCSEQEFWSNGIVNAMGYGNAKDLLLKVREHDEDREGRIPWDELGSIKALLNIPALAAVLAGSVRSAMDQIAQWQGSMLAAPTNVSVHLKGDVKDLRVKDELVEVLMLCEGKVDMCILGTDEVSDTFPVDNAIDAKFYDDGCLALVEKEKAFTLQQNSFASKGSKTVHQFTDFVPEMLIVGGRIGKQVAMVFEKGGRGWNVLDLEGLGL